MTWLSCPKCGTVNKLKRDDSHIGSIFGLEYQTYNCECGYNGTS